MFEETLMRKTPFWELSVMNDQSSPARKRHILAGTAKAASESLPAVCFDKSASVKSSIHRYDVRRNKILTCNKKGRVQEESMTGA
jgi:hypothetical protein